MPSLKSNPMEPAWKPLTKPYDMKETYACPIVQDYIFTCKKNTSNTAETVPVEQAHCSEKVEISNDMSFDDMMQDLSVSQALLAAAGFNTLSIMETDQLLKRRHQSKKQLDAMYERARLFTTSARATLKVSNLITSSPELMLLRECIHQATALIDELCFTTKYVHHLETSYLRHTAGTLCQKVENEAKPASNYTSAQDKVCLEGFLHRLRNISDDEAMYISSPSTPSSSTTTLSSSVTLSSSSTLSSSGTIIDPTTDLVEQIDLVIDDLSFQFKHKQARLLEYKEHMKRADLYKKIIKQRERSAGLVLELEKTRAQRLAKEKSDMASIQDQLKKETQAMDDQIRVFKSKIMVKDQVIKNFDLEIKSLRSQLQQQKPAQHLNKIRPVRIHTGGKIPRPRVDYLLGDSTK